MKFSHWSIPFDKDNCLNHWSIWSNGSYYFIPFSLVLPCTFSSVNKYYLLLQTILFLLTQTNRFHRFWSPNSFLLLHSHNLFTNHYSILSNRISSFCHHQISFTVYQIYSYDTMLLLRLRLVWNAVIVGVVLAHGDSMFGIRSRSYKHLGSQIWYETIWSKEQLE